MAKGKRYSMAFRERAVRRMKLGDNVSKLTRELGVDRTCLYMWKRKLEKRRYRRVAEQEPDWRDHRIEELEQKIARLERIIGGQSVDLDFFENALRRVGETARKSGSGKKTSTPRSVPECARKAD
jgi:transposase